MNANRNVLLNAITKFSDETVIDRYEAVKDYFFHYMSEVENNKIGAYDTSVSFAEKEEKVYQAFLSEVGRISGYPKPDSLSFELWSANPQVKWATFATMGLMIDAVIPDTLIKSTGLWTDITPVGYGETLEVTIEPNSLFTVSQGSNSKRHTFVQKQFPISKTLVPVNHELTVEVSLYKVLAGKESIARFLRKAVISMETEFTKDAYMAFDAVVEAGSFPTELKHTGYTVDDLLRLCEVVSAYNGGARVAILGTSRALNKVVPDAAVGYRINTDSDNANIQLIKGFFDYDIIKLPQVATGRGYKLALKDDRVYIVALGADKIIKSAIEGQSLTNIDQPYDNANLVQKATINKRWVCEAVTNATMGCLKFA